MPESVNPYWMDFIRNVSWSYPSQYFRHDAPVLYNENNPQSAFISLTPEPWHSVTTADDLHLDPDPDPTASQGGNMRTYEHILAALGATTHQQQRAVIDWIKDFHHELPRGSWIIASPNSRPYVRQVGRRYDDYGKPALNVTLGDTIVGTNIVEQDKPYSISSLNFFAQHYAVPTMNTNLYRNSFKINGTLIPVWTLGGKQYTYFCLIRGATGTEWAERFSLIYSPYMVETNDIYLSESREKNAKVEEFRRKMEKNMRESMVRKTKPVRSGMGDFDQFLYQRRDAVVLERAVDAFDVPEHGFLSSLNWGIEVEVAGARGVERPKGWDAKYDGSLDSAYYGYAGDEPEYPHISDSTRAERERHNPTLYDHDAGEFVANPLYTPEDQCEACVAYNEAYRIWEGSTTEEDCREFTSPILHSYHSKGLEQIVTQASTQPQNSTAGIHVHVEASHLTTKQLGSLVYGYNVIEPILVSSYQRETREYCKYRESDEAQYILRALKNEPYLPVKEFSSVGDRYVSLNLCSLRKYGTVEFRAMGPVYEYEYLIKWAQICRELVNIAKAGMTSRDWHSIKSAADLRAMFVRKGRETAEVALQQIDGTAITEMWTLNNNYRSIDSADTAMVAALAGEV